MGYFPPEGQGPDDTDVGSTPIPEPDHGVLVLDLRIPPIDHSGHIPDPDPEFADLPPRDQVMTYLEFCNIPYVEMDAEMAQSFAHSLGHRMVNVVEYYDEDGQIKMREKQGTFDEWIKVTPAVAMRLLLS